MEIPLEVLIDKYVEAGLVPDNFTHTWKIYADWQFNSLASLGLKPSHSILDIGCGPLRLGLRAIEYLDDGNYCGMDAFERYIKLGNALVEYMALHKKYQILHSSNFEFYKFNKKFDFAIAQSVLTHLSLSGVENCINEMKKVMNKGSLFLFTYNIHEYSRGFLYYDQPMIAGCNCNETFFQNLATKYDLEFSIPSISHPSQKVGILKF
jgi:cyclopropane fatty-acyl-phospholipid synthase-like methyltransferase